MIISMSTMVALHIESKGQWLPQTAEAKNKPHTIYIDLLSQSMQKFMCEMTKTVKIKTDTWMTHERHVSNPKVCTFHLQFDDKTMQFTGSENICIKQVLLSNNVINEYKCICMLQNRQQSLPTRMTVAPTLLVLVNKACSLPYHHFARYCRTLNFGVWVNVIILDPVILAFLLPTTLKRYYIQIFVARYFRELARLAKFAK